MSNNDVQDGAMVALIPSQKDIDRIAAISKEPAQQLHVTIRYLGKVDQYDESSLQEIIDIVKKAINGVAWVKAEAFNISLFNPGTENACIVLGISGEQIDIAHSKIIDSLDAAGYVLPDEKKPWIAHLTLEYLEGNEPDINKYKDLIGPITFDRVRIALGENNTDLPLGWHSVQEQAKSLINNSIIEEKVVRHVRTPRGVRKFHLPMGSVIVGGSKLNNLEEVITRHRTGEVYLKAKRADKEFYRIRKERGGKYSVTKVGDSKKPVIIADTEDDAYKELDKLVAVSKSNGSTDNIAKPKSVTSIAKEAITERAQLNAENVMPEAKPISRKPRASLSKFSTGSNAMPVGSVAPQQFRTVQRDSLITKPAQAQLVDQRIAYIKDKDRRKSNIQAMHAIAKKEKVAAQQEKDEKIGTARVIKKAKSAVEDLAKDRNKSGIFDQIIAAIKNAFSGSFDKDKLADVKKKIDMTKLTIEQRKLIRNTVLANMRKKLPRGK